MMAAAPSGVVTFLVTEVEGSTRRWETDADHPSEPRTTGRDVAD